MEKRILGIILSIIGVIGLVMCAVAVINGGTTNRGVKETMVFGVLGAIFFFSGIGLIKRTSDKAT